MTHPPLLFAIILINWPSHHQNLGVYLDEKSNSISISKKKKKKIGKATKGIGINKRVPSTCSQESITYHL